MKGKGMSPLKDNLSKTADRTTYVVSHIKTCGLLLMLQSCYVISRWSLTAEFQQLIGWYQRLIQRTGLHRRVNRLAGPDWVSISTLVVNDCKESEWDIRRFVLLTAGGASHLA